MADQAYGRGLEVREEMFESEHGSAKLASAEEFTHEPRDAAAALDELAGA